MFYAAKAPPNTVSGSPSGTVLVNGKPYSRRADSLRREGGRDEGRGHVEPTGGHSSRPRAVAASRAQFILLRAKDAGKPIVELRLTGGDFKACAKRAAQSRAKTAKTVRRLWAKGSGKFRTRGRYASAAIRGTDWLTADRCDSTFVKIAGGCRLRARPRPEEDSSRQRRPELCRRTKKPKPTAATRTIVGDFAGPMVFRTAGGSIWQTQYARVSVTKSGASVRWTYVPVPWSAQATCTHVLNASFRVTSTTGSCIPNAKSYRISLDHGRAAVRLEYSSGITASGRLPRR